MKQDGGRCGDLKPLWEEGEAMEINHTFVICAYKESEYLEECILSLRRQTVPSLLVMVTSTPSLWLESMAERYQIPLFVNEGEGGITQDWNFGLQQVTTGYATIAHQDDTYEERYTEKILAEMESAGNPLIAFTDYAELRHGERVVNTAMLRIKRLMLLPMRVRCFRSSRFVRRRVLSLGDPICCPSVTFCLDNLVQPIFSHGFRSCEDWEAWERISKEKGEFIYIPEALMCHRIHAESTTTEVLQDHARAEENYIMFRKFWPGWMARMINHFYNRSEKSNQLE